MVLIEEVESPRASDRKDEGNAFFGKGRHDEAIDAFSQGIRKINDKSLPDPSVLYSNRAMCYMKQEDYRRALSDSNDAIKQNKGNAKAWHRKGQCLAKLGRVEDARAAFQKSLEVAPQSLRASIESSIKELPAPVATTSKDASGDGAEANKSKISSSESVSASKNTTTTASTKTKTPAAAGVKNTTAAATSTSTTATSTKKSAPASSTKTDPSSAEFAHPGIKIQYVPGKGRGLVATKEISRGELIISASPVFTAKKIDAKSKVASMLNANQLKEDDARLMLQLHAETANNTIKQQVLKRDDLPICPSVDGILMRDRKKPITSDTADRLTSTIVAEILDANAYGFDDGLDNVNTGTGDECGLWILPSFVNHGCLSNVTRRVRKETMQLEIRAGRDIAIGEELVTTYCATTNPVHLRDAALKAYGFVSQDLRCRLERAIVPKAEAEAWWAENTKISQSINLQKLEETQAAFGALKSKIETKLKQLLVSKKAVLEREGCSDRIHEVFDWLRASYMSIYYGEAIGAERLLGMKPGLCDEAEVSCLFRQAATLAGTVFPSNPYETHFISRAAGGTSEAQYIWRCYAGGGKKEFTERYPDLGGEYSPRKPLKWVKSVATKGFPSLYRLEISEAPSDSAKVEVSEREIRISFGAEKRYATLPVDCNKLLGVEAVRDPKTGSLVITMGIKRGAWSNRAAVAGS